MQPKGGFPLFQDENRSGREYSRTAPNAVHPPPFHAPQRRLHVSFVWGVLKNTHAWNNRIRSLGPQAWAFFKSCPGDTNLWLCENYQLPTSQLHEHCWTCQECCQITLSSGSALKDSHIQGVSTELQAGRKQTAESHPGPWSSGVGSPLTELNRLT